MSQKLVALILIAAMICCNSASVMAAGNETASTLGVYATGNFSLDIPAGEIIGANSTIPLDDGDTFVVQAAFTPPSASMDFGIVAPNGQFYYVNVTGGIADIAIDITRRGNYTFAIRNNSSSPVTVSGYINY